MATGILGFSEEEFWLSTLAKVMARLYVHVELERRRAFPAALAAAASISYGDKKITPNDILNTVWPLPKDVKAVTVTHDPDDGALGDWQGLKQSLRDRTRRIRKYPYAGSR